MIQIEGNKQNILELISSIRNMKNDLTDVLEIQSFVRNKFREKSFQKIIDNVNNNQITPDQFE